MATKRILIYAIGSLGDNIASIPALRAIRAHFGPGTTVCLLHDVQNSVYVTSEAVLGATGLIDRFIGYRFHRSAARQLLMAVGLWRKLYKLRFDAVISLLPGERPAQALRRDSIFFRLCGIREQIGFSESPGPDLYRRDANGDLMRAPHESQTRLRRLASTIPYEKSSCDSIPLVAIPEVERLAAEQWLRSRRHYRGRKLIAICPGCKQPANAWNVNNFIELGRRLAASGEFEIVVVGGPAERTVAQILTTRWNAGIVAAGEFSVMGSAAILDQCEFMIGLDTGTTHLAAAVGTPCIVLQGARNSPGMWDPIGPGHTVIRKRVPCAGCRQFVCPNPDHPCMRAITIGDVWASVNSLVVQRGQPMPASVEIA